MHTPDDVLRRMLATKPKPKEKGREPKPAPQKSELDRSGD